MTGKEIDFTSGEWIFKHIGKNIYKVYPLIAPHGMVIPAAATITKQLPISFSHRIIRIHFYHTDSAYAASIASLTFMLERLASSMTPSKFADMLYRKTDITTSKNIVTFGEGFEFDSCVWSITFASTATDIVFPIFYIQKLGETD